MPMSWTAENDRLLLLKLIETHGISVDSSKIAAAWPDGGVKPSARAVTERFVKLRKDSGLKASITTTPGRGRPRASKYTTPKKRKTKADSDESDAEGHYTDQEKNTPTKASAQNGTSGRGTSGRGRGSGRGGRGSRGGRVGMLAAGSPAVRIKTEYPSDSLDIADFERDSARATELREAAEDPFTDFGMPMHAPNRGISASISEDLNAMAQTSGTPNGYARSSVGDGMHAFNNGFASPTYAQSYVPVKTQHLPILGQDFCSVQGLGVGADDPFRDPRPSAAPSDASNSRARSNRKASAQASEGMAAWLRRQKDEDENDGAKSSEEDSQASEYHDIDGDYI
ncbi:hypothetical protein N0V90_000807 [Kalmusia sp. IMI 367209]|nr:hypothetical protein N0V90_000807 [Kalmusia sp. IMI 367209]